jgi:hypothetical protein
VKFDELVDAICQLKELQALLVRQVVWLSRAMAEKIVELAGGENGLIWVDFTGCGMNPGHSLWTREWNARDSLRAECIFV